MPTKSKPAPKGKLNRSQAVRDYLAENPGSSPKAVVSALKAKGITISLSLANAIRYAKPKSATKAVGKRAGRPKGGVNRSEAIRQYLSQNPGASPRDIKAALKAKGIVVTDSLVGAIKYSKKARSGRKAGRPARRPSGRPVGRPPSAPKSGFLRAEDLVEAKNFANRVGGVGAARKALDLLAQLS
ncbi:MAG: hypothetical protein HYR85_13020 [Planctomycetes bacterium]|nr:hypothetical protein [Planctomycetota bacterium]MBI3847898.1 hypothetical protein [Planctomycetota bacterium]